MSVLAGFFTGWRGPVPRRLIRAVRQATVRPRPVPARPPETETERVLLDTLAVRGPLPLRALVSHAACALYRLELAHGGALADVGLFGENLFAPEVARALETGRGALWDIEPEP